MGSKSTDIAYQNKDIVSKLFGEKMKNKPLSLFGLKSDRTVVEVLPTNLPILTVKELRIDNLFRLDDGSIAIIDYESTFKKENYLKYGEYMLRITRKLLEEGDNSDIHMMVLYTADVENVEPIFSKSGYDIKIEPAYLVGMDSDAWMRDVQIGIDSQAITDDILMKLVLLPLTHKGKTAKQISIQQCAELARKITDHDKATFAIAGILAFTDKLIDSEMKSKLEEVLKMTQVGEMLIEEGRQEGRQEGRKEGRQKGQQEGQYQKLADLIAKNLLTIEVAASSEKLTVPELMQKFVEYGLDKNI